ncbi:DNA-binding response regulator [Megasphaera sp. AM44-1BH]|uniref:response regulator transcription factor n=1 Tax=Megasphaera sp. AM44-1BH TaxID=2292358 RepID=UPI000E48F6B0|nr:response regulator transcription factor [Megasphaera sp. AM44-1BH]RHA13814.1 DNA-binding response regulator [Megasphaera sp. AM44-1BH]
MKILLAEDEKDMSAALVAILTHSGYEVDPVYDGEAAVQMAQRHSYDCMVFDIMMPKLDGVQALQQIRDGGDVTPVIMLTAKSEVADRINGLDAGADDYLTKPFAMAELLARLRAMTRRSTAFTPQKLQTGSVSLDVAEQELCSTNVVRLSAKETKLMQLLMLNADKDLTTGEILSRVWPDEEEDEKIVWIYISYLKEKLAAIDADVTITGGEGGPFRLVQES